MDKPNSTGERSRAEIEAELESSLAGMEALALELLANGPEGWERVVSTAITGNELLLEEFNS